MLHTSYPLLAAVLGAFVGVTSATPMPATPLQPDRTTLIGNGSPAQTYKYEQVTEPLGCGDDTCTAGQSKTFSVSVGFSVGSGGGPANFINGGFAVQSSWSTTETDSCSGKSGDTVCLWYAIAHTVYDVTACTNGNHCANTTLTSPNKDNLGGGYLCGKNGQCGAIHQDFWKNGPSGGPQANPSTLSQSNLP